MPKIDIQLSVSQFDVGGLLRKVIGKVVKDKMLTPKKIFLPSSNMVQEAMYNEMICRWCNKKQGTVEKEK